MLFRAYVPSQKKIFKIWNCEKILMWITENLLLDSVAGPTVLGSNDGISWWLAGRNLDQMYWIVFCDKVWEYVTPFKSPWESRAPNFKARSWSSVSFMSPSKSPFSSKIVCVYVSLSSWKFQREFGGVLGNLPFWPEFHCNRSKKQVTIWTIRYDFRNIFWLVW